MPKIQIHPFADRFVSTIGGGIRTTTSPALSRFMDDRNSIDGVLQLTEDERPSRLLNGQPKSPQSAQSHRPPCPSDSREELPPFDHHPSPPVSIDQLSESTQRA